MSKHLTVQQKKMTNSHIESPANILQQQLQLVDELYSLLQEENHALKQKSTDKLQDITQLKSALIEQIKILDKTFFESKTHHNNQKDTSFSKELVNNIQEIKTQLDACHKLNSINANAVNYQLSSIQRLEQALRNTTQTNEMIYDKKGKATSVSTSKQLKA